MNLQDYLAIRKAREGREPQYRERCLHCFRPLQVCYCPAIRPFASVPRFAFLIHPEETKKGIATGRMAHLCLSNSLFIRGMDFSKDERVNGLLQDPANHPVLLYPGPQAVNLSLLSQDDRQTLFPRSKQLIFFLLDATWTQAKQMRRLSRNLDPLPCISFTPPTPSGFRQVRKQPFDYCYSTIEAAHQIIDLLSAKDSRPHDNLLEVFHQMVETQEVFHKKKMRLDC